MDDAFHAHTLLEAQQQQPVVRPNVYPSQMIAHVHELSSQVMNIVAAVEMFRDSAAGYPMAPPELIDRLDAWVDALSVGHAHAGGILAICSRLHQQERGS